LEGALVLLLLLLLKPWFDFMLADKVAAVPRRLHNAPGVCSTCAMPLHAASIAHCAAPSNNLGQSSCIPNINQQKHVPAVLSMQHLHITTSHCHMM
jgi:hypothetical protein